jgi:hypothetical protein
MYIPLFAQLVDDTILFLLAMSIIVDDVDDDVECMEKPSADSSADNPTATTQIFTIQLML